MSAESGYFAADALRHCRQVYVNTLRNWASLDADRCRVRAMLYATNTTGVEGYVLTELAVQLGWEVFAAPKLSEHGIPFVKSMYMHAYEHHPNCSFYAYSNGDILYSRGIIDTLEEVAKVSVMSKLKPGMLRLRGPCGLKANSFGLGLSLTLSGLGLDLGLMASGLGLIEIGLVASNIYDAHDIN